MPLVEREFEVKAPLRDVWELLNNPVELGKCISGCEEVIVVNATEWKWKVKFAVGVVSRRIDARIRLIQKEEPNKISLKMESVDGDLTAQLGIELSNGSGSSSHVKFSANVDARGPFQWIVNQIIKSQLDKLVGEFAQCVSTKLGKA